MRSATCEVNSGTSLIWQHLPVDETGLGLIVDFMVHAFEELAHDLHMTESTIGLVFSSAGTSFPDFLASLIVAKKGMADMAVRLILRFIQSFRFMWMT
jgi:hypothetical protein